MTEYKTIQSAGIDNFVEKRSKFIGYSKPVTTEEEAIAFINELRSKHWDATHNVYAYVLRKNSIMRYSDDGEPQGTAGMPVLDVIQKSGVTDVVVVVTRYFGGVLLGTGGLVRAYSNGAKIALEAGKIITMRECVLCSIDCTYTQYGKLSSLIIALGGTVDDTIFTDNVQIQFHIVPDYLGGLEKQILDATCGDVTVQTGEKQYFLYE